MKMDVKKWIFLLVFIFFSVVKEVATMYCAYKTSTGVTQRTYCMQKCCEGPDVTFDNVCCGSYHESHAFIGLGVAGTVLISSLIYACFKHYCSKQRVPSGSTSRNDQLSTISYHVHPQPPPPYTSPPPYCPQEPGTSVKVEEWFTKPKDPPPPYSLHDTPSYHAVNVI